MPKIAYIDKDFYSKSLALIDKVNEVVEDYQARGYSLTLRQVYYQMVARDLIPNNLTSYKNLGNIINDGRLAGRIDWHAIEDRTRNLTRLSHWEGPKDILRSSRRSFHTNNWIGQEYYVEVWVEKEALIDVVRRAANTLDVPYFACRGYVSQSEMWSAAQRMIDMASSYDRKPVILHLGDHDPSGIDMSRDIIDRMEMFGVPGLIFDRLALNMDQIEEYNPPPNPAKLSDSRVWGYMEKFGNKSWELDALDVSVIDQLIKDNIRRYMDMDLYRKAIDEQERHREDLTMLERYYDTIINNLDDIVDVYGYEEDEDLYE